MKRSMKYVCLLFKLVVYWFDINQCDSVPQICTRNSLVSKSALLFRCIRRKNYNKHFEYINVTYQSARNRKLQCRPCQYEEISSSNPRLYTLTSYNIKIISVILCQSPSFHPNSFDLLEHGNTGPLSPGSGSECEVMWGCAFQVYLGDDRMIPWAVLE